MNELDVGSVVNCKYCNAQHEIDLDDVEELMIVGKTVIECEECHRLFTVCEDLVEGKSVYFIK